MIMKEVCFTPLKLIYYSFDFNKTSNICKLKFSMTTQGIDFSLYLKLLLATILSELILITLIIRREIKWIEKVKLAVILNLTTHPIVAYLMPLVFSKISLNYSNAIWFGESFAIIIEAILIIKILETPILYGFVVSFLINILSWWLGLYIF